MKVLLVDDHVMVRQGLRSLLEDKLSINVAGEASDGRVALQMLETIRPDLVIMDIAMPGLNGLEALQQMLMVKPTTRIIILSMHIDKTYINRALRYGACGYVYKGSAFEDLELAIKAAITGDTFLSPKISSLLVENLRNGFKDTEKNQAVELLSPREREVMQLITEEKTRTQIADILSISVKTVDRHRENLKEKLQIKNEEEIVKIAREFGLTSF